MLIAVIGHVNSKVPPRLYLLFPFSIPSDKHSDKDIVGWHQKKTLSFLAWENRTELSTRGFASPSRPLAPPDDAVSIATTVSWVTPVNVTVALIAVAAATLQMVHKALLAKTARDRQIELIHRANFISQRRSNYAFVFVFDHFICNPKVIMKRETSK